MSQSMTRPQSNEYIRNWLCRYADLGVFLRHYAVHYKKSVTCIITENLHQEYKSISNPFDQSYVLTHSIGQRNKDVFYCKQVEN